MKLVHFKNCIKITRRGDGKYKIIANTRSLIPPILFMPDNVDGFLNILIIFYLDSTASQKRECEYIVVDFDILRCPKEVAPIKNGYEFRDNKLYRKIHNQIEEVECEYKLLKVECMEDQYCNSEICWNKLKEKLGCI